MAKSFGVGGNRLGKVSAPLAASSARSRSFQTRAIENNTARSRIFSAGIAGGSAFLCRLGTSFCVTGKNPTDEYLEGMMSEAPGPINFTMFLTMFGEKLNGTDPEDVIRNAFACFDEEATGFIHEDHLRELLTTMGDRFTDEEVDEMYREAPIDKKGNFNYVEFTRILKHGAKDKDD
ncbi:myosin regulatory light polypeptide 9 isoform X1 [Podarcis raffonei]|uniref:Myosin light chain 9 n=1 Tax=Podarcis muralis TaxID=64176 RepID=A0A670K9L8_PODMU|nr:myosin regulatory light polypeptide 9 isoform X1 [Podarcis raffonei]